MMFRGAVRSFRGDDIGAIGPLYAVGILVLVAVAGVGFDYGRLASLDSELQNAADQGALAGATQLDGKSNACQRAANAVSHYVLNHTRIANDGISPAVTFITTATDCTGALSGTTGSFIKFWQDKNRVTPATGDDDAKFIEVSVDARSVRYALTPLVGVVSSGLMEAKAMAGLGSSVCKTPPVFMCNPFEADTLGGIGAAFDAEGLKGAGVTLLAGSPQTPGNFGFLDTDFGDNSTPSLAKALGWNEIPGDCAPIGEAGLKPGHRDVVFDAFNTRFDIDQNGANTCPSGGTCSAAMNTRKDLIRKNQCGTNGNNGWKEPPTPYRPTSGHRLYVTGDTYPEIMGYPRDICHAISFDGDCASGIVGDKSWDRDAYFHVNYNWSPGTWQTNTSLPANVSRYAVYEWEKTNPPAVQSLGASVGSAYSQPICLPAAGASDSDRRRFTMAVVNCRDEQPKITGNGLVKILKWVDVFLVEPAYNRGSGPSKRTSDDQVYVEILGESKIAGSGDLTPQSIRRDVPYLVR